MHACVCTCSHCGRYDFIQSDKHAAICNEVVRDVSMYHTVIQSPNGPHSVGLLNVSMSGAYVVRARRALRPWALEQAHQTVLNHQNNPCSPAFGSWSCVWAAYAR